MKMAIASRGWTSITRPLPTYIRGRSRHNAVAKRQEIVYTFTAE
jgi:hypothetical protein